MSVLTAQAPPRSGGGLALVRRRPVTAFFVMAMAASWIAWLPYILSNHGLGVWDFWFPGGSIGGQLLGMLPGAYLGPIVSALVVTAIADGRAGLRAWVRRLWNWRVSWRWYAGILLGVPAAMVLAALVIRGGEAHLPSAAVLLALVPGLLVQLVTTGLAEEPGWRDFALPRVQRTLGAPRAAVLIGVLWGFWHFPLYLTEWGQGDVPWFRPVAFVAFCVLLNVVMTWVFNRTGQSLPMTMLLHAGINNFASVAWEDMFPGMDYDTLQLALLLASGVGAALVVWGTRGRLGYAPPTVVDVPVVELPRPLVAARLS